MASYKKYDKRLKRLLRLIKTGQTGSLEELSIKLCVSKRTVKRMVRHLRDMNNNIYYCRVKQCYIIDN